jgi:hypothetical protein
VLSSFDWLNLEGLLPDAGLGRDFAVLENDRTKQRWVITINCDGFTIWDSHNSQRVTDPNFEFKLGNKMEIVDDNRKIHTFTMKDALTDEIEQHVSFDNYEKDEDVATTEKHQKTADRGTR